EPPYDARAGDVVLVVARNVVGIVALEAVVEAQVDIWSNEVRQNHVSRGLDIEIAPILIERKIEDVVDLLVVPALEDPNTCAEENSPAIDREVIGHTPADLRKVARKQRPHEAEEVTDRITSGLAY